MQIFKCLNCYFQTQMGTSSKTLVSGNNNLSIQMYQKDKADNKMHNITYKADNYKWFSLFSH